MINDTTSRIICIVAVVLNGPFPTEQFRDCLLSFFDEQNYGLQRRMTTLTQNLHTIGRSHRPLPTDSEGSKMQSSISARRPSGVSDGLCRTLLPANGEPVSYACASFYELDKSLK
jgi:hypothetical protein